MTDHLEGNKALVREVFERVINRHDVSLIETYYPEDYLQRESHIPQGREGLRWVLDTMFTAAPDIEVHILFQVAEDDLVVSFCEFSGTHLGDYFGRPPSGRRFRQQAIEIFRVRDSMLVEHWGVGSEFETLET